MPEPLPSSAVLPVCTDKTNAETNVVTQLPGNTTVGNNTLELAQTLFAAAKLQQVLKEPLWQRTCASVQMYSGYACLYIFTIDLFVFIGVFLGFYENPRNHPPRPQGLLAHWSVTSEIHSRSRSYRARRFTFSLATMASATIRSSTASGTRSVVASSRPKTWSQQYDSLSIL